MSDEVEDTKKKLIEALDDPDATEGAREILHAYHDWRKDRKAKDCLDELGIRMGEPPFNAQMSAVVAMVERIEEGNDAMETVGDAVLFGMWLGSRLERLGMKKGGD